MSNHLLLVFAVLSHCTVPGLSDSVLALEGGDVILPCSFNITANGDFPDVEWSKGGLDPNVVLLYRDGYETAEMKNPLFQFRSSLIPKELKHGNISLRISNVRLSDAGRYQCMTLWRNGRHPKHSREPKQDVTTVELVVGTVSEPKLSVVSVGCGGVNLQCEANYSLPEPEITFLDGEGHEVAADEPKKDHDGRGNYTVRRRLALHSDANSFKLSITCRVQQPGFNMIRDINILVPVDVLKSYCLITFITLGWTILVFLFTCGLAVWLWKRCGKSAKGQSLSDIRRMSAQSPLSIHVAGSQLEPSDCADNGGDCSPESLRGQVALLKLQLHDRNETIRHLLSTGAGQYKWPRIISSEHMSANGAPPKPVTSRTSIPTDRKSHRRNSSPESLSPSLPRRRLAKIGRSLSESSAHKCQRRLSSGLQPKPQSTNKYSSLLDVTEESEPLMSRRTLQRMHRIDY